MTASRLDAIDLDSVRDGVEAAVRAANDAIRGVLAQATMKVESKGEDGPVTEADYAADAVLHEQLMPLISGARWLSEESSEEAPLIRGEATWIIDPLDGTREFLRGLPEYGVSVGLFVDDRLVLGAVGFPWDGTVLSGLVTRDRRESRRDGVPMAMLANDGVVERVVVSRHDYEHRRLQYRIPYEVYPCGSAAVKLVHAAQIATDVYFSTGPRSVWDVAGGVAVLEGVGGVLMSIEGKQIALSPQQIHVPPYVAGAPADCLTLLQQTGLLARTLQTPPWTA
ncbi:MAG: inositol monophosphatase family protein [Chloroflexota bacterium]